MRRFRQSVKSGAAMLVACITFCAAAATLPTSSATATNVKKKTTLTKSELLALSTAEPTFTAAGTLFSVGKAAMNDEVKQQLCFQAAGAALIACGRIDVYEQRIKDQLNEIEFEAQLAKTGLVGMDGDAFSRKLIDVCATCEGSGRTKVECAGCNGSGHCQSCGGAGRKRHRLVRGSVIKDCSVCKGRGACPKCKGKQIISRVCNRCNGQEKIVNTAEARTLYSKTCKALANYAAVTENAIRAAIARALPDDGEICTSVIGICGVHVGDDLLSAKKVLAEKDLDLTVKRRPEEDKGVETCWEVTNLGSEGVPLGKFSGEPINADAIIFWTDRFGIIYSLTVRVYFPSRDARRRIRELAADDEKEGCCDSLWLFFRNEIVKRMTELKLDCEESGSRYELTDSWHSYVRSGFSSDSLELTITDINRQKAVDQAIKAAKEKASRERYANDTNNL